MDKAEILRENQFRFPVITRIRFERLYLTLEIFDEQDRYYYLHRPKTKPLLLEKVASGENTYSITIKLFCVRNETFLPNGLYWIGFYDVVLASLLSRTKNPFFSCAISDELALNIASKSRIYKYGNNSYAYNISFDVFSSKDVIMHTMMSSYFMKRDDKWFSRKSLSASDGQRRKQKLRFAFSNISNKILNFIYRAMCFVYKQQDVLIIYKFTGSLAGNLKALYERLLSRGVDQRRKIILQSSDGGGRKMGLTEYFRFLKNLAQAEYIFVDGPVPLLKYISLVDTTHLVQLWHAGAGFKGAGFARFGVGASLFPNNLSHKQVRYALAPSEQLIDVFQEVMGIERDKFFVANMPRLSGFLDPENIEQVLTQYYEKYPQLEGKKVILFAPTYRGRVGNGYYPYHAMDFSRIHDFLSDDTIMVVKFHPNIKVRPDLSQYEDRIIDLSYETEINDILLFSDVLITDYSSTYYEYALLKRPMLFYCFDKYIYENTRGVYQRVDDAAPGKVVNTFEELLTALQTEDYEYEKTLRFYDDHFANYRDQEDGSDYVIDHFLL